MKLNDASVLKYLKARGYKRTAKRFIKEARFKEDDSSDLDSTEKTVNTDLSIKSLKRKKKLDSEPKSKKHRSVLTPPPRPVAPVPPPDDEFKRINVDKVKTELLKDERLKDLSFASKMGDNFAAKAAKDLGRVRGKDFRKEMAKKKKASWRGQGPLDIEGVNSIQFSD